MKSMILITLMTLSSTVFATSIRGPYSCPRGYDYVVGCSPENSTDNFQAFIICENEEGLVAQITTLQEGVSQPMEAIRNTRVGATTYRAEDGIGLAYKLVTTSSAPVRKNGQVYRMATLTVDDGMTKDVMKVRCSR